MRDEEKGPEQCRRRTYPRGCRGGTTPGLSFEGGDARKWGGKDKTFNDRNWSSATARRRSECGLKSERNRLLCSFSSWTWNEGEEKEWIGEAGYKQE
jgi:hypothetical protein